MKSVPDIFFKQIFCLHCVFIYLVFKIYLGTNSELSSPWRLAIILAVLAAYFSNKAEAVSRVKAV